MNEECTIYTSDWKCSLANNDVASEYSICGWYTGTIYTKSRSDTLRSVETNHNISEDDKKLVVDH